MHLNRACITRSGRHITIQIEDDKASTTDIDFREQVADHFVTTGSN